MRLVFLGDISVARSHSYSLEGLDFLMDADQVIANLEGPILPARDIDLIQEKKMRVLYNSPRVIDILKGFQVDIVSLANNHIFDYGDSLAYTKSLLEDAGIGYFGAGENLAQAREPYLLDGKDQKVKIFGFGWDVIGCQYATSDRSGINPFEPDYLLDIIRILRKSDHESKVIFFIHWNYELEPYPQPADRQLARKLIEEGVDVVIGNHPHLAQGGENHLENPIFYSLGNWFFPPRKFGPVSLDFSPQPSLQLAAEVEFGKGRETSALFHWLEFDSENKELKFQKTETWEEDHLVHLTPFSGISDPEYIRWFKRHRSKRYSLPVYKNYQLRIENWIKDKYILLRQQLIWLLVKCQLKK